MKRRSPHATHGRTAFALAGVMCDGIAGLSPCAAASRQGLQYSSRTIAAHPQTSHELAARFAQGPIAEAAPHGFAAPSADALTEERTSAMKPKKKTLDVAGKPKAPKQTRAERDVKERVDAELRRAACIDGSEAPTKSRGPRR
jgi:hypothetical protein